MNIAGYVVRRRAFWATVSPWSQATFLAGVFFLFVPIGLMNDIVTLGTNSPARLGAQIMFSSGAAVAYVLVGRRPRWLPLLVGVHVLLAVKFDVLAPARTAPLSPEALRARLGFDTSVIATAIMVGFALVANFVQREGMRYARAHAEIALASDIHRLLVPPIARTVGAFEFRGISLASGAVGGDLIDIVESDGRWIGYVADVSGHGVGAGLLMGMAKSAVRTHLLTPQPLECLLNDLNVVLSDLRKPEMFVTFAAIQFDETDELEFSVAGHLPILHYHADASALTELSIPQVPLAMFEACSFSAARIAVREGDLLVILTDGLTEVFDRHDQEFGLERVKELIREHAAMPLDRLEETLLAAVRAHGPQIDDQTVLLIRCAPKASFSPPSVEP